MIDLTEQQFFDYININVKPGKGAMNNGYIYN